MAENSNPYKNSPLPKKEQVKYMFDRISGGYDGLNRVISFGMDVVWRKRMVRLLKKKNPKTILDVATGTGDLALALAETGAEKIVGLDLAPQMLEVAQKKVKDKNLQHRIVLQEGDSENLPFTKDCFDAVTVAFGVRNFENLEKGLQEILRVLRPGGTLVVLETAVPAKSPLKQGYRIYTKYMLPKLGKLFSKDSSAYTYLSESASVFPHGQAFNTILRKVGFMEVVNLPQTFGVASIYIATK